LYFIIGSGSICFAESDNEQLLETIFKLTDFVDWPEQAFESTTAEFNFCFSIESNKTFKIRSQGWPERVGDRPVRIKIVTPVEELQECHILFITGHELSSYSKGFANAESYTLTVSDMHDFAVHGGAIEIANIGNKVSFTVNIDTTKRAGLYMHANLLQMSRIVNQESMAMHSNRREQSVPDSGLALAKYRSGLEYETPKPVERVPPKYPKYALKHGIEGYVDVKMVVGPNGRVHEVIFLDSKPDEIFNKAAYSAVKQWKFDPVGEGSSLVLRNITQRINFQINNRFR